jgi:hypothetical protein
MKKFFKILLFIFFSEILGAFPKSMSNNFESGSRSLGLKPDKAHGGQVKNE